MRFESLLWTLLALLLAGSAGIDTFASPLQDDGHFEATDGSSQVPPPGCP